MDGNGLRDVIDEISFSSGWPNGRGNDLACGHLKVDHQTLSAMSDILKLPSLNEAGFRRFGDAFEVTEASPPEWWTMLDRMFQRWQPLCVGVMPLELFQGTLDCYAKLYASLPEPDGPCWVHFDYRPGNVLVQGTRITGLIDFESSRGGSADLDFIKVKNRVWDVCPGTKEAFLNGYTSVRPLPDIESTLPSRCCQPFLRHSDESLEDVEVVMEDHKVVGEADDARGALLGAASRKAVSSETVGTAGRPLPCLARRSLPLLPLC